MSQSGAPLQRFYGLRLVALCVLIAVLASLTVLDPIKTANGDLL
jgi:hypothetical protein